jgi:quinol monooxygenase YgiN
MLIVLVYVHVKPEYVDQFREATLENVRNSIQEPGIARFDFMQEVEDNTRFTLYEVYRDADAQARHKETAHYLRWRDTVVDMMAEPRKGVKHNNLFPDNEGW